MYDKVVDLDIGALRHFPLWHVRVFFMALTAINRAREATWTKRRKWRQHVDKHMSLMKLWVTERKAINLVHKYQILQAELMTLARTPPEVSILVAAYDRGIRQAAKSGFVQDAALGAALAARAIKDPLEQDHYAKLAQANYARWGAYGVLRYLQLNSVIHQKATSLVDKCTPSEAAEGIRSRRRFSVSEKSFNGTGNRNQMGSSNSFDRRGSSGLGFGEEDTGTKRQSLAGMGTENMSLSAYRNHSKSFSGKSHDDNPFI